MNTVSTKTALLLCGALTLTLTAACGQSTPEEPAAPAATQQAPAAAPADARASHVFKGRIEAVDPAAKTLTVTNENVEGWMMPMTMSYSADKDDVYGKVKPGDQITATVYDGDFKTLYNVQVVDGDSK
jgi:Cu/Ag efflux protein CusF